MKHFCFVGGCGGSLALSGVGGRGFVFSPGNVFCFSGGRGGFFLPLLDSLMSLFMFLVVRSFGFKEVGGRIGAFLLDF